MPALPREIVDLMTPFAPVFTNPTWRKVQMLWLGAVLAPGKRTVTSVLRILGRADRADFSKYHQVLNRASWSARRASKVLLDLLVSRLVPADGPLIMAIDETIERRRGKRIATKGVYRDSVHSSKSHFVKTMGLRWIVIQLLIDVPWSSRRWALPFFAVLAPSKRYYESRGRQPMTMIERAGQMVIQLQRWLPDRQIVLLGDRSYSTRPFIARCQAKAVTLIAPLRMDAALYEPAPPRKPGTLGRPRKKGERLPSPKAHLDDPTTIWRRVRVKWYDGCYRYLELATGTAIWTGSGKPVIPLRWVLIRDPKGRSDPQALLSSDPSLDERQILCWYLQRWQAEVTFEDVRAHLGVETQRQWSDLAIARTTPVLLALYSWITLAAHALFPEGDLPIRTAAWYEKSEATFSDAIAAVRRVMWPAQSFYMSPKRTDMLEIPRPVFELFVDSLCYAA
jgi:hypothetical protein